MATGKGVVKGKVRDVGLERRWRRIMSEQRRSGLTVREFCRRGKLAETSFHYWRRELRRRQAESSPVEPFPRRQSEPSGRRQAERASRGSMKSSSRRRVRRSGRSVVPSFVAVRVEEHGVGTSGGDGRHPAGGHMEIVLRCGRHVRVTGPVDRAALADVVSALEGLPVAASDDGVSGIVAAGTGGVVAVASTVPGTADFPGNVLAGREVRRC